jgi:hypothetical protein
MTATNKAGQLFKGLSGLFSARGPTTTLSHLTASKYAVDSEHETELQVATSREYDPL